MLNLLFAKFAPRLYYVNPWQDTAHGTCDSFTLYCKQPVNFFMQRFTGMTLPVAEYLANNVFCILDDPIDDSQRVEASEFGTWIKDLPSLFTDTYDHKRVTSPSSKHAFMALPLTRRRKRNARKRKDSSVPRPLPSLSGSPIDDTLEALATASQSLAREISKVSRSSLKPLDSSNMSVPVIQAPPAVTTKPSKWKMSFGKNSPSGEQPLASPVDEAPLTAMSTTANNITSLLLGLHAPSSPSAISRSKPPDADQSPSLVRGRRPKFPAPSVPTSARQPSPPLARDHRAKSPRTHSPSSTRNGRPVSASSKVADNWRSSTSTAMSSSSASSGSSNSSSRSVSTQASSVSASSWRTRGTIQSEYKNPHSPLSTHNDATQQLPTNVKCKCCLLYVLFLLNNIVSLEWCAMGA